METAYIDNSFTTEKGKEVLVFTKDDKLVELDDEEMELTMLIGESFGMDLTNAEEYGKYLRGLCIDYYKSTLEDGGFDEAKW